MIFLLIFCMINTVTAQNLPTETTIKDCWALGVTYRFCALTSGNSLSPKIDVYSWTGWCCPDASTDERCTHGPIYTCTLNKNDMIYPLYMSYWVGMIPSKCGGESRLLTASATS